MLRKNKKILILLFKIAIVFLAFWYIWLKIKVFSLSDFTFPAFNLYSYLQIFTVLLLIPVNWLTESYKWKFLLKKIEVIKLKIAFKAVLSGISFALISPNRIGEIAGRVFVLKKQNRGKAIFATAVGSLSQMMITLVFGLISGIILLFVYPEKLQIVNTQNLFYFKILSISVVIFGFLFLFNLKYVVLLAEKLRINLKFIQYLKPLSEYSFKEVCFVLALSFLRYVIFSLQFVLLLFFFNTRIEFFDALIGISLTYFISSLIPVLTFLEIGIRGMAAVFFLGMFSADIPGIISAVTILWLLNLAIPGIIGSFLFFKTKV